MTLVELFPHYSPSFLRSQFLLVSFSFPNLSFTSRIRGLSTHACEKYTMFDPRRGYMRKTGCKLPLLQLRLLLKLPAAIMFLFQIALLRFDQRFLIEMLSNFVNPLYLMLCCRLGFAAASLPPARFLSSESGGVSLMSSTSLWCVTSRLRSVSSGDWTRSPRNH